MGYIYSSPVLFESASVLYHKYDSIVLENINHIPTSPHLYDMVISTPDQVFTSTMQVHSNNNKSDHKSIYPFIYIVQ